MTLAFTIHGRSDYKLSIIGLQYENIEIPIAIPRVLTCANHTHKAHGVGDGLSLSLFHSNLATVEIL